MEKPPSAGRCAPGEQILVSGPLGEHGVTILAAWEDLPLQAPMKSDTAPLHTLVDALLRAAPGTKALRDPTRGGFATAVNELARASGTLAFLREADITIRRPVDTACEILGADPPYLANEGKLIAVTPPEDAAAALAALRAHPLGEDAAIVGEMTADAHGFAQMETPMGGRRMVDWLIGDPLPCIC